MTRSQNRHDFWKNFFYHQLVLNILWVGHSYTSGDLPCYFFVESLNLIESARVRLMKKVVSL